MAAHVRDAIAADVPLLARWAVAMADESEGRALDPATVSAGIAAAVADPVRGRVLVAMREAPAAGRELVALPAGTLMVTREWSDWRNGWWWWIQSVYVPPEHRRHGVFATLYRHVEAEARATPGVAGLRLYVERDNAAALSTYGALGMEDAGYALLERTFGAQGSSPADSQ
ncbi:GNAT family N-acetyltransferase [Luteimonas pelagia]